MIPGDISDESTHRVPLYHLKKLSLRGDCRHVFRLLDRNSMSKQRIFRNSSRHTCRTASGVMTGSRVDWGYASPKSDYISFGVGTVGEFNPLTMLPETGHSFVSFTVPSEDLFPQGAEERLRQPHCGRRPRACRIFHRGAQRGCHEGPARRHAEHRVPKPYGVCNSGLAPSPRSVPPRKIFTIPATPMSGLF